MMLPAAAAQTRVTRTAVRMSMMTAAAMLTTPTAPSTTTARPSPVEVAPLPQHADPGLHMVVPLRASWPSVTSPLPSAAVRAHLPGPPAAAAARPDARQPGSPGPRRKGAAPGRLGPPADQGTPAGGVTWVAVGRRC